ncbi:hypothetical protein PDIDSM_4053 [Penicillium digitatum]|nr:hypothetical protein PDIDSM_4053 [Penicillium digitatum]
MKPSEYPTEPIVVVGAGCRFPGGISSPSKLWDAICSQRDVLSTIPPSRFNPKGFYHPNGERHGSTNVSKAYLLEGDISAFDATFFGINPREAEAIDPQHPMLLETVYEAMEDAGLTISNMKGSDTAVYVGLMTGDYHELQIRDPENMPIYMATGTARSILSNRLSYFFDWKGPSMTIDTACSSSLVALHYAVQSLRAGECQVAVAAGANLILGPEMMIAEANLHMLSPTGRSRMWDAAADGYARGEGFSAVMLKTLSQAIADEDHIDYIIRETGVNQDGRTKGITMPSSSSQAALIRQTYQKAGLDCSRLDDRCQFFEAHGTGTPRGDPIEAQAIHDAFFASKSSEKCNFYVGSVKTVIGHLEGCAGLAGLLKAGEAVRRGQIPPNMHFNHMNPEIIPFFNECTVPTKALPWPTSSGIRRASVNSFGFGGTNAHAIIESYDQPHKEPSTSKNCLPLPFTFSASNESSLSPNIRNCVELLESNDSLELNDVASALLTQRSQLSVRVAFSGASRALLIEKMKNFLEQNSPGDRIQNKTGPAKILGVFTGQGAQWSRMGREIIKSSPLARWTVQNMQRSLDSLPDRPSWSIEDLLVNMEDPSQIQEAALSQPLCTAIQIMLVELLRAAGIYFHSVVGHSSGEIGAAYAARLLSAEDAIRIAYYRGLFAKLAGSATGGSGSMMAAALSLDDANIFISANGLEGRVSIAASNAPQSVTLSGDEDAIAKAKVMLDEQQIFCRLLKVDTAYHSHHMIPCLESYCEALRACNISPMESTDGCFWVSSVHGRLMTVAKEHQSLKETYWRDNMAQTVLFSQAVQASHSINGPFDIGLEVGPHPALKGPTTQTIKAESNHALPYSGTLSRFRNDVDAMADLLGFIWKELGTQAVDFIQYSQKAFEISTGKLPRQSLPRYSWDHSQRFWKESVKSRNYRLRSLNRHDILGARCPDDHAYDMRWRKHIRVSEVPWLSGHKVQGQIIFPAAGYFVMAMEAAKELSDNKQIAMVELQNVEISKAIILSEDSAVDVMFHLKPFLGASPRMAEFSCYSATSDENGAKWHHNVSGHVTVHLSHEGLFELPRKQKSPASLVPVNIEYFYSSLANIGLEYTGMFQRLNQIQRRSGRAIGYAQDIPDDSKMPVMIHPALLDASFQTIFASFFWPGDGTLQSPYVPTFLQSLRVIPTPIGSCAENMVVDCTITDSKPQVVTADLEIFSYSQPRVQLEGLTCTLLGQPVSLNDCELFAKTLWKADVDYGLEALELPTDSTSDVELVDLCERLSYSYLRELNSVVNREDVKKFVWHHQRIFEFIDDLFPLIESGKHPTIRKEWANDSHDWLLSEVEKHPGQVDLQLISAVGNNLAAVVYGKTTMLEHMIENDVLDRFYKYGLGFQRANGALSHLASQISHRYPRMNVLEVGAGTGGATTGVLEQLSGTFANYTFTDTSTGFFEKAQKQFLSWASKMTYKALNIEGDVAAQGFKDGSFDLVIASNVLHATQNLEFTMQNVRRLLKPGGYLLLLEVTSDILRVKLMMSGLQGWWLGDSDGRRFAPTISDAQWDNLLIKTGFSGIQHRITDFEDTSKHMTSVILSQAISEAFAQLKNPLEQTTPCLPVNRIAVIGGQSPATKALADDVVSLLSQWSTVSPLQLNAFEETLRHPNAGITSIISLADLDEPLLKKISQERLSGIQSAIEGCRQIVWVTSGAHNQNPHANMTIGLGRSLIYEYPHIRMQFMDIAHDTHNKSVHVATALARLLVEDKCGLPSSEMLWSVEPEVILENGKTMIPRLIPNDQMNSRLNAGTRQITKSTSSTNSSILISRGDHGFSLHAREKPTFSTSDAISIRVICALLHEIQITSTTRTNIVSGIIEHPGSSKAFTAGDSVLALAGYSASYIQVPPEQVIPIDNLNPGRLLQVAIALVARSALSAVKPRGTVLLLDPDISLQHAIEAEAAETDIAVLVATSDYQNPYAIHISQFLTQRQLKALFPPSIDLVVDSSSQKNQSLRNFLAHCRTVTMAELFSLQPAVKPNALFGNTVCHRNLLKARNMIVSNFPGIADRAHLIPLNHLMKLSPNTASWLSVIDFASASVIQTIVEPIQPRDLFHPNCSYLLVGCTGGLGQSLTRWMVKNGARYIVLTSRQVSKVDRAWLDELRQMGAEIQLHELDISNKQALLTMRANLQNSFPPIAGVTNAAMVLSDRLFSDMTVEHLNMVLEPKVTGSANLDEIFSTPTLDFFVLFSSLASVVGNRGQSNYGAANLFMTSLAAQRKRKGLVGSVLDIGMVLGIGYVSQNSIYETTLRRFNYMPISEPKFHIMFAEAISAGRPESKTQAEIITGLHRIAESGDSGENAFWAGTPRFSHYTIQEGLGQEQFSTTILPLQKQLADVKDLEQASKIVLGGFLSKLERVLQVPAAKINPAQPLVNLGVDSLMAVEVRSWFVKEINTDIPVLRILGGASSAELCTEAAQKHVTTKTPSNDRLNENFSTASLASFSQENDHSQANSSATSETGSITKDFPEKEEDLTAKDVKIQRLIHSASTIHRMSFAQERLWFLHLFLEDPSAYNVTMMYHVHGPSAVAICNAMNIVLTRHQSLRTAFFSDPKTGLPSQYVLPSASTSVKQQSLKNERAAYEEFNQLRHYTYDLDNGETAAATLLSEAETDHILILGFHHIVFDGFSAQIFVKDFASVIAGKHLPTLEHQYIEFADRQRHLVQSTMETDLKYWKSQFLDLPNPLPLFEFSLVKSRKPLTTYDMHGAQHIIPSNTASVFKSKIRGLNATPFYGHLAILQILLYRFLNVDDVCIGITDANRTDTEFLDTIGFFVNLLPLRFALDGNLSFEDLLVRTLKVTFEALEHSRVPFDVLLDSLSLPRSTTQSPLFQVLLNYKMGSTNSITMTGFEAHLVKFEDASNPYDLIFDIEEQLDGTTLVGLKSQSYLYSQRDLSMILGAYNCVLESCLSKPDLNISQHELYHLEDALAAVSLGKGPRLDFDDSVTLSSRIDDVAAFHGKEVAIKDSEGSFLSYESMNRRVYHIAATLEADGIGSGDYVAVYCEPSINSVCYLLAIWRLNAVYVPLDPQNPIERLQTILDDCRPLAIIHHERTKDNTQKLNLGAIKPVSFSSFDSFLSVAITNRAQPVSPACVLYTSGSTGKPKGIVLTHANLNNQIIFDSCGTLIIASRHLRGDPLKLTRLIVAEKISYTYATPSEYASWLRYGSGNLHELTCWKTAIVGGEALPAHLIRQFQELSLPGQRLINRYGPTEITVSNSCMSFNISDPTVADSPAISIGTTLPNYSTYILAPDGSPVPAGFVGEIVVGGSGVALGYLGRDELTCQKFVPDPFASKEDNDHGRTTMYHTGDKGRLLSNGEIFYLGRMDGDNQIKLRGFRVELDEIASNILCQANGRIIDAVVSVRGENDEDGDRRYLVAWIIPSRLTCATDDLEEFLSALPSRLPLPSYMIPRICVTVEDFPRTPNGKLDRRVLDQLELPKAADHGSSLEFTAEEQVMIEMWKTCLGESGLLTTWSRSTDFFQVGGNSLLMIRLKALIQEKLGFDLPLTSLFQSSTIEGIAKQCLSKTSKLSKPIIDWPTETRPGEEERRSACSKPSTVILNTDGTKECFEILLTGQLGSWVQPSYNDLEVKSAKIIQYAGDLTLPRLGLDRDTWELLGNTVDAIIHNGADVSFLKSYHSLRAANLQSTRQLACFALKKSIPLHFVSTGGVSQLARVVELPPQSVSHFTPPLDGSNGYVASKWAAEIYLEACASQFNLPSTIHRPSNIIGEGVPATDLIQSILKISVDRGAVPTTDGWAGGFDFVPVADVATGICNAILKREDTVSDRLQILHHCGDVKIPVGDLKTFLEHRFGVELRIVDVDTWMEEARQSDLPEALESLIGATLRSENGQVVPYLSRS